MNIERNNSHIYYMYMQCKVQADFHFKQYLKYLSHAKYFEQLRQQCLAHSASSSHVYKNTSQEGTDLEQTTDSYNSKRTKKRRRRRTERNNLQYDTHNQQYNDSNNLQYGDNNFQYSQNKNLECDSNDQFNVSNNQQYDENNDTQDDFSNKGMENSNDEEFEVDPAFKEFLKKSQEFRRARDAEKHRLESKDKENGDKVGNTSVEYVDVMRKGPEGSIFPPTAVNRKELYEERYGEKGITILNLETTLQWKYNKFTDSKTPKPWPNIPIKL